ncbi:hypothetical protein SUGI_0523950 [Cryptomeria japonica]|nr:hypothetical protein SUGI_0523950 [Cryptomeria japonica]
MMAISNLNKRPRTKCLGGIFDIATAHTNESLKQVITLFSEGIEWDNMETSNFFINHRDTLLSPLQVERTSKVLSGLHLLLHHKPKKADESGM